MDALFIYPKTGLDVGGTIAPPFGIMFAASILDKEGYKVKLIDARVDNNWESKLKKELKKKPLVIGISCMTSPQIIHALSVAKIVRENSKAVIVWGGPHPTMKPAQTLENDLVDIVVRNEGEYTFYELVKALKNKKSIAKILGIGYKNKGKIIQTKPRRLLLGHEIPDTPWHLIDVEKYIYKSFFMSGSDRTLDIGETSRGCPFRCAFCFSSASKSFYWRPMSAERTSKMIIDTVKKFNLTGFWLRDDNFYVDHKRAKKIFENIMDAKLNVKWYTAGTRINDFNKMNDEMINLMKKSGCNTLKFGAESGSDRILKFIKKQQTVKDIIDSNKKAKKYGIIPAYVFIVGFPTETLKEVYKTVDTVQKIRTDNPQAIIDAVHVFTPHHGTELYDIVKPYLKKEPKKLEDWSSWTFQQQNKHDWFDDKTRRIIQNIANMSIMTGCVSSVFNSIDNPIKRIFLKMVIFVPEKYYRYLWKKRKFNHIPSLGLVRFVRKIWLGY